MYKPWIDERTNEPLERNPSGGGGAGSKSPARPTPSAPATAPATSSSNGGGGGVGVVGASSASPPSSSFLANQAGLLPAAAACSYAPCFCEENVWKLCEHLKKNAAGPNQLSRVSE